MGLPISEWKNTLLALLDDPDTEVSVLVAAHIAGLEGFAAVDRAKLVSRLFQGLRHEDFYVRTAAQAKLRKLVGQGFCVDPTDPLSEREPAIRRWEERWMER